MAGFIPQLKQRDFSRELGKVATLIGASSDLISSLTIKRILLRSVKN